jgi:hypothetical protein
VSKASKNTDRIAPYLRKHYAYRLVGRWFTFQYTKTIKICYKYVLKLINVKCVAVSYELGGFIQHIYAII